MQCISQLLTDAPLIGPPPGFADRVAQRLAQRQARRQELSVGMALLVACLSLVALALPETIRWLAMLWQVITEPSLLSHGAKLAAQLLNLAESVGGACWLIITVLPSYLSQPALLGYSFLVLALTGLWTARCLNFQGPVAPDVWRQERWCTIFFEKHGVSPTFD